MSESASRSTRSEAETAAIAQLRVLLVDDMDHVRTWARKVLNGVGITDVEEAANGHEALARIAAPGREYDLIICDLRMPDRDGIETLRTFAALGVGSAVLIMSVEEERILESAGLLAKLHGLRLIGTIAKPLTPEKLEPMLGKIHPQATKGADATVSAPEQDIDRALTGGELFMMYQPKVWMQSGKFAGVEALVRWRHPELGLFQPAAFVPQMEQSDDHSAALARFVSTEAIACAGRWVEAGRELKVAINLAARAFDDLDLPERMVALCAKAHVPPEMITLEVTETQVARDAVKMLDVATRLRLKGFSLAVDDFGTGHSGLSALQRLPFNELKIDRQFVNGCSTSASARSVVEASLALARSLKMTAVAEGVQSRPDWDLLAGLGCDIMQGFFIARPMTEEGLDAWSTQWGLMRVS